MADNNNKERRVSMVEHNKDIKEILNIVKNIEVQNATRDAERKALLASVTKHEMCLEGNGKPGLKADVEKLQNTVKIAMWPLGIAASAFILDAVSRFITLMK